MATNETELLALLGLDPITVRGFIRNGANRILVLSAIAQLRDEAKEALTESDIMQAQLIAEDRAGNTESANDCKVMMRRKREQFEVKLADMGALLAMVLR